MNFTLEHRAVPPHGVRQTLRVVRRYERDHRFGGAYEVDKFVRQRTGLHVDIPPGVFHGAGVGPIQCKATPVSTLLH